MKAKMVYTEDFRRKVVQEVVSGKWTGYSHAQRVYGIKGSLTVRRWIEQYGYGHLLQRIVVMKSNEEIDEVKKLRAELKRLKESLADVYLDLQIEKQISQILLKETGRKREEVKKNMPGRSPTES